MRQRAKDELPTRSKLSFCHVNSFFGWFSKPVLRMTNRRGRIDGSFSRLWRVTHESQATFLGETAEGLREE